MSKTLRLLSKPLYTLLLLAAYNAVAQPKINSFTPASGPVGTPVTLSGSGFNASAAGNLIYFGAVRAAVTSASATSLTVTVPAGATYQPISVLNSANALTGYTATPFVVTFPPPSGPGIGTNFYRSKVDFAAASITNDLEIIDLDGDGKSDMVAADYGADAISIFRNTAVAGTISPASFAAKADLGTGSRPFSLAAGDIDGDGKPDLVVANSNSSFITIYRNRSTAGSITAASFVRTDIEVGFSSNYAAIADLDGDGKPDILIGGNALTVLRNISTAGSITTASFAPKVTFAGVSSLFFVACDIDGDTKPELISLDMAVMHNVSTPGSITTASFEAPVYFWTGATATAVAAGDLDGDGKADVVVADFFANQVSVFRNTAKPGAITASSFAPRVDIPFTDPSVTRSAVIGDADGDGKPDIIVADQGAGLVSVLRNTATIGSISTASFASRADFRTDSLCFIVAMGDLDGDGVPEVAACHAGSKNISVLNTSFTPATPVVSSFSPASGTPGTTVTLDGGNFNASPAGNTVFFGAVKATVTSASVTRLTVTVPAGATYQPISVLNNTNGLTGYTNRPFVITFTSNLNRSSIPADYFKPRIDIASGTLPFFSASTDLDGDGKADLVTANASTNTVSIIRNLSTPGNLGSASFGSKTDLPAGSDPRSIAIGDLDGDGKPDIVVANSGAGTISVLRNKAAAGVLDAASFAARVDFATGANPFSVAIGDVDADGRPDIVVANLGSNTVSVLRNITATGVINASSFASRVDYAAGASPRAVVLSDLDGDLKTDIAVVNEQSNTVSVLRNAYSGKLDASSFAAPVSFAAGNSPDCIAAGDLNKDGKPDIVVSNYGSNSVSVLRNTAVAGSVTTASFAAGINFTTGPQPFYTTLADLDGDGKPEIITVNTGSNTVSVLRNAIPDGAALSYGSFDAKTDFPAGGYPVGIAAGDLDGDGIADLMCANAGTNSISVLTINQPYTTIVTSFTPERGPVRTTVTIKGANFNTIPSKNTVYFGTVKASVAAASATSLTVTVPDGATSAPVSVLNNATGLTTYSSKPFGVIFANPFGSGVPANFYRQRIDVNVDNNFTYGVAFGSIDVDYPLDMVTVNERTGNVSALTNAASKGNVDAGSFIRKVNFPVGTGPRAVSLQDMDGDGLLDIVALNPALHTLNILKGTLATHNITSSTFVSGGSFDAGTYISSFAIGDLDGDGRPDAVVTNQYLGTISVLRNAGPYNSASVTFATKVDFAAGDNPRAVAISDVDGDGRPDIVVANEGSNTVSVWRNTAITGIIDAGSFAAKADFPVGTNPPSVAVGDVDGDGKTDIVVANYGSNSVSVLRNTGVAGSITAATFAARVDFLTDVNPFCIAMGDVDGDGKADVVTANSTANTISVLRNTSTAGSIDAASFAARVNFNSSGYPLYVTFADVDYDGLPEVVTANAASGNVSIWKIASPAASALAAASDAKAQAGEQSTAGVQVYPNPTQGTVTLQLADLKGTAAGVEILNENGTVIQKQTVTSGSSSLLRLNLRNQPAGVYYVKITGVDGIQITKVIKR